MLDVDGHWISSRGSIRGMTWVKRALAPIGVLIFLTGCAGGDPTPVVTETVTATPEPAPTVTETPAPGPTVTVTATPEAAEESEGDTEEDVDRTDEVREIAGDDVTRAAEVSPGQFTINTSLIDPRGDDGSPEAQAAIAICEAVQQELSATHVRVMESDESTLVTLGSYSKACTET